MNINTVAAAISATGAKLYGQTDAGVPGWVDGDSLVGVYSIADLTALQAFDGPQTTVYLKGRTTAGDGGEGVFVWNATDLSTQVTADTLHGIYVPSDSDPTGASGSWVRQSTETDVAFFGADNTGVTSSSASFNAATSFLRSHGGGVLKIPSGTYTVNDWTVYKGITVIGDGALTTTLIPDGNAGSVLKIHHLSDSPAPTYGEGRISDIRLYGFTINGTATKATVVNQHGIWIEPALVGVADLWATVGITNVRIEDIRILSMSGRGLHVRAQSYTTGPAIFRYVQAVYTKNVFIQSCGMAGLFIQGLVIESDFSGVFLASNGPAIMAPDVSDGVFSTGVPWTAGTGCTITGGKASWDGSQSADSDLTQAYTLATGRSVKISVTVSNRTAGTVKMLLCDSVGTAISADGTYVADITKSSGGSIIGMRADADFIGKVDAYIVDLAEEDLLKSNLVIEPEGLVAAPSTEGHMSYPARISFHNCVFGNITKFIANATDNSIIASIRGGRQIKFDVLDMEGVSTGFRVDTPWPSLQPVKDIILDTINIETNSPYVRAKGIEIRNAVRVGVENIQTDASTGIGLHINTASYSYVKNVMIDDMTIFSDTTPISDGRYNFIAGTGALTITQPGVTKVLGAGGAADELASIAFNSTNSLNKLSNQFTLLVNQAATSPVFLDKAVLAVATIPVHIKKSIFLHSKASITLTYDVFSNSLIEVGRNVYEENTVVAKTIAANSFSILNNDFVSVTNTAGAVDLSTIINGMTISSVAKRIQGQVLTVHFGDSNITVLHNSGADGIYLKGLASHNYAAGDLLQLRFMTDRWYEI